MTAVEPQTLRIAAFRFCLGMGTSGPEARSTVRPEQRLSSWSGKGPKVDYKELLKPEEFEVFSRLREWRKAAAEN